MQIGDIIDVAVGALGGGTISTLLTYKLTRRKTEAQVHDIELDTAEKESAVNAKRAERAWERADKLEDRIDELIKEIDLLKDELIRVKIELTKVTAEKIELEGNYNKLKKKVQFECKCLEINWDEYK